MGIALGGTNAGNVETARIFLVNMLASVTHWGETGGTLGDKE